MNKNTLLFFILIISISAGSCRSKKNLTTATPAIKERDTRYFKNYMSGQVDYLSFSSKMKCEFSTDEKHIGLTIHLKMEKDKYIWMSASPLLGLEAMRIMITKDSVLMLDRLNRTYYAGPVSYFKKYTEVPLNLGYLQNILVGNAIINPQDTMVPDTSGGKYRYIMELENLLYTLLLESGSFKIENNKLKEKGKDQSVEVRYSLFQKAGDKLIPFYLDIKIDADKDVTALIHHENPSFESFSPVGFSIPSNYQRIE